MTTDYDKADLDEVCNWMHDVLGYGIDPGDFPEKWKNGVLLCELANKLKPGIVAKINKGNVAFLKLENIENFTKAARQLGVIDRYNFVHTYLAKFLMVLVMSSQYCLRSSSRFRPSAVSE